MDEHTPAGEPIDAYDEDTVNDELLDAETADLDEPSDEMDQVDEAVVEEASAEYLGRWNRLISTTNWERGRIISAWRQALIDSEAPQQAYSDEAWARRVNNVSGQHVGRLRRVYDRFGETYENYSGLFWSRRSFIKKPGVITLEILPPIAPGKPRREFLAELEQHIEGTSQRLAHQADTSQAAQTRNQPAVDEPVD